jgi:hypothetical protein
VGDCSSSSSSAQSVRLHARQYAIARLLLLKLTLQVVTF